MMSLVRTGSVFGSRRTEMSSLARTSVKALRAPLAMGARGMASEQELRARITSTTNIQKITKSMKMVAAAKMKKEEERCVVRLPPRARCLLRHLPTRSHRAHHPRTPCIRTTAQAEGHEVVRLDLRAPLRLGPRVDGPRH